MIVALCADKGSPGVTTAAMALGLAWPGRRVVVEADPSGGDLAFRARDPLTGNLIRAGHGLLTLAADVRGGVAPDAFPRYAHPTVWGVDVICGPPSAAAFAPMRSLWPAVADAAAAWPGTALVDLGRLYPGSPAIPFAQQAAGLLVLSEVSVESLFHLRDRLPELVSRFVDPSHAVPRVAVIALARRREGAVAVRQVVKVLESVGCPVPVLGALAFDLPSARSLREGRLTTRLARGDLVRSAVDVAARVRERWPELVGAELVEAATS